MKSFILFCISLIILISLIWFYLTHGGLRKTYEYFESKITKKAGTLIKSSNEFIKEKVNQVKSSIRTQLDKKLLQVYSDAHNIALEDLDIVDKKEYDYDEVSNVKVIPDHDPEYKKKFKTTTSDKYYKLIDDIFSQKTFSFGDLGDLFIKMCNENNLKNFHRLNYKMYEPLGKDTAFSVSGMKNQEEFAVIYDINAGSIKNDIRNSILTIIPSSLVRYCKSIQTKTGIHTTQVLSIYGTNVSESENKVVGTTFMYKKENGIFIEVNSINLESLQEFKYFIKSEADLINYIAQYYRELSKLCHSLHVKTSFIPLLMPAYNLDKVKPKMYKLNGMEMDQKGFMRYAAKGSIIGLLDAMNNYPDIYFVICCHSS
ncbi:hypothetical protein H311_01648 [Anncaliia algerae PRA109]|nr:hypothetical protein H311_01648 [Anncaliia algerae PRA109]